MTTSSPITTEQDELRSKIERAIASDQIDILFQPQVEAGSGLVVGAEALARWHHEDDAARLFSIAEEIGLGCRLSRHVQRKALALAARWTGPLKGMSLSINVRPDDLVAQDYVEWLSHEIVAQRFEPPRLTIELTETSLLADPARGKAALDELRALGLRTALDDLGTGYANLAYLAQLPLDAIKIDRGLVAEIGSEKGRILVRTLIGMARELGMKTIVEGVETIAQHALVHEWGCDLVQGFLAAGPMSDVELARFVAVSRTAAA